MSEVVQELPAFDPKLFLSTANHRRTISAYRAGDVIYSQGDPADAVFYIHGGSVKVVVTSEHGKEGVVGILSPGDFLGEGCLTGQVARLASAVALLDCKVLRIEKGEMVRALRAEPALAEVFLSRLLARKGRVEADLADHLFNSSEKRLARTLLLLANFGKEGAPTEIAGKVSQETLAAIVGTTRSRISYFMNKFRRLGYIDYNGRLKVHSSLLTVVLHD